MKAIEKGLDENDELKKKHAAWQEQALKDGQESKAELLEQEFVIHFSVKHPFMSGNDVAKETKNKMTSHWVNVNRKRN